MGKLEAITIEEEVRLLEGFREGDQEVGRKLLESKRRLVERLAGKFSGSGVDRSDLEWVGYKGLYSAFAEYKGENEARFDSLAYRCIVNAMIDEIRATRRRARPFSYLFACSIEDGNEVADILNKKRDGRELRIFTDYLDKFTWSKIMEFLNSSGLGGVIIKLNLGLEGEVPMTFREISYRLQIPVSSACVKGGRILNKLREMLSE